MELRGAVPTQNGLSITTGSSVVPSMVPIYPIEFTRRFRKFRASLAKRAVEMESGRCRFGPVELGGLKKTVRWEK